MRNSTVITRDLAELADLAALREGRRTVSTPPSWAVKQCHFVTCDAQGGWHCFIYGRPVDQPDAAPSLWVRWVDAVTLLDRRERTLKAEWNVTGVRRRCLPLLRGFPPERVVARVQDRAHRTACAIHVSVWRSWVRRFRPDLGAEAELIVLEAIRAVETAPPAKRRGPGRPRSTKPRREPLPPGRAAFYPPEGVSPIPPNLPPPARGD